MGALIPSLKSLGKLAIGIIVIMAIAELTGLSSFIAQPIDFVKSKLPKG